MLSCTQQALIYCIHGNVFAGRTTMVKSENEAYRLLESTLTRGVNRALDRSKPAAVRLIWVTAVVMCSGMLLYHTCYLVQSYLKFGYTTNIRERLLHNKSNHQVCSPHASHISLVVAVVVYVAALCLRPPSVTCKLSLNHS